MTVGRFVWLASICFAAALAFEFSELWRERADLERSIGRYQRALEELETRDQNPAPSIKRPQAQRAKAVRAPSNPKLREPRPAPEASQSSAPPSVDPPPRATVLPTRIEVPLPAIERARWVGFLRIAGARQAEVELDGQRFWLEEGEEVSGLELIHVGPEVALFRASRRMQPKRLASRTLSQGAQP